MLVYVVAPLQTHLLGLGRVSRRDRTVRSSDGRCRAGDTRMFVVSVRTRFPEMAEMRKSTRTQI